MKNVLFFIFILILQLYSTDSRAQQVTENIEIENNNKIFVSITDVSFFKGLSAPSFKWTRSSFPAEKNEKSAWF